jgi:hypothetical protein
MQPCGTTAMNEQSSVNQTWAGMSNRLHTPCDAWHDLLIFKENNLLSDTVYRLALDFY